MLSEKLGCLYFSPILNYEVLQSEDEGKDIALYKQEIERVNTMPFGADKEILASSLIQKLNALPVISGYRYSEPEEYSEIIKSLENSYDEIYTYDISKFEQKVLGAWLGRSIGCLLGIPVETWERNKILDFLKETDNYPMKRYISSDIGNEIRIKYGITDNDEGTPYDRQKKIWINNTTEFPVDDDTNYTVCSLKLIERFGIEFTAEEVAETWLFGFPALHACTAERVAYKNLLNCILPPLSAKYLNPFREWIGAQIRTDFYGYISPGNPSLAASMAYRDASVSHVKNGVYGAMYIAALVSLAPCGKEMEWVINGAMKQIPPKSRLYEGLEKIRVLHTEGKNFQQILDRIHEEFNEKNWFDWCHSIPNAMIVTAILLTGSNDFDRAIADAVMSGFDTDCNGATVGSIVGMMNGSSAIDAKWLKDISPTLTTSIHGYSSFTIAELVSRTLNLVTNKTNRR